jgi:hypothetical protein
MLRSSISACLHCTSYNLHYIKKPVLFSIASTPPLPPLLPPRGHAGPDGSSRLDRRAGASQCQPEVAPAVLAGSLSSGRARMRAARQRRGGVRTDDAARRTAAERDAAISAEETHRGDRPADRHGLCATHPDEQSLLAVRNHSSRHDRGLLTLSLHASSINIASCCKFKLSRNRSRARARDRAALIFKFNCALIMKLHDLECARYISRRIYTYARRPQLLAADLNQMRRCSNRMSTFV